jgi:hypothetical protein
MKKPRAIEIVAYRVEWADDFTAIAGELERALGPRPRPTPR